MGITQNSSRKLSFVFDFVGKKRKAKEGKKGNKKKKKRKNSESDLSEPEFEVEEAEEMLPKRGKRGAKKDAAESASGDDKPSVADVCENFGLTDVDLEYNEADYQNLTTYKLFQSTYRQRIQAANVKVKETF